MLWPLAAAGGPAGGWSFGWLVWLIPFLFFCPVAVKKKTGDQVFDTKCVVAPACGPAGVLELTVWMDGNRVRSSGGSGEKGEMAMASCYRLMGFGVALFARGSVGKLGMDYEVGR